MKWIVYWNKINTNPFTFGWILKPNVYTSLNNNTKRSWTKKMQHLFCCVQFNMLVPKVCNFLLRKKCTTQYSILTTHNKYAQKIGRQKQTKIFLKMYFKQKLPCFGNWFGLWLNYDKDMKGNLSSVYSSAIQFGMNLTRIPPHIQ